MALAPDDVIKKNFNATHLRRGYDETQVDDFLDEVVVELRRLNAAKDELQTQLADCLAGRGLDDGEGSDDVTARTVGSDEQQPEEVRGVREALLTEIEELSARVERTRVEADAEEHRLVQLQQQAEAVQRAESSAAPAAAAATTGDAAAEGLTAIISLAQRLHDQHVQEGENTRQRLVSEAENYRDNVVGDADRRSQELVQTGQARHDELVQTGQAKHDELVQTGQAKHDELVQTGQAKHDELVQTGQAKHVQLLGEAEQRRTDVLSDLDTKQSALSSRIEDLKAFEREYRGRLRGMLTEQMAVLDRDGDGVPDRAPGRR